MTMNAHRNRHGVTLIELLVLLLIVAAVAALLLPATRSARGAARRSQCNGNLKQIGLALHNYVEVYGSLPPAMTVDAGGTPLHSWRTLLLPFVDEQTLYDSIDLTKPWDAAENKTARETVVSVFRCPSVSGGAGEFATTYEAVVGPDATFLPTRGRKLEEITDGLSETVAIVEVPVDRARHWMSPRDLPLDQFGILSQGPNVHEDGHFCASLDGRVPFVMFDDDLNAAAATISAGDDSPLAR